LTTANSNDTDAGFQEQKSQQPEEDPAERKIPPLEDDDLTHQQRDAAAPIPTNPTVPSPAADARHFSDKNTNEDEECDSDDDSRSCDGPPPFPSVEVAEFGGDSDARPSTAGPVSAGTSPHQRLQEKEQQGQRGQRGGWRQWRQRGYRSTRPRGKKVRLSSRWCGRVL